MPWHTVGDEKQKQHKQNIMECCYSGKGIKVIRHVFGFGIEILENKDIGIFVHLVAIDFIMRYSYHMYFSPILTS